MSRAPPRVSRLLKGTFTAGEAVEGWRHFHVVSLRKGAAGWEAELAASCDEGRRVWVLAAKLLRKEGWAPGWTPLRDL